MHRFFFSLNGLHHEKKIPKLLLPSDLLLENNPNQPILSFSFSHFTIELKASITCLSWTYRQGVWRTGGKHPPTWNSNSLLLSILMIYDERWLWLRFKLHRNRIWDCFRSKKFFLSISLFSVCSLVTFTIYLHFSFQVKLYLLHQRKKRFIYPAAATGLLLCPLLCLTTTYYHLYFHIITTTLQKQVPKNNKKQKQIIKNKKQNIRVSQQCLYDYTKRFVLKNLSISSNLYVCIISICWAQNREHIINNSTVDKFRLVLILVTREFAKILKYSVSESEK